MAKKAKDRKKPRPGYVTVPSLTQPGETIRLSFESVRILQRVQALAQMKVALERLEKLVGRPRLYGDESAPVQDAEPVATASPPARRRPKTQPAWKSLSLWA